MHHPHDTLFQITMNQPGSAEALIQYCATFEGYENLATALPGASVVSIPGSFVDRNYEKLHSDRLYRVDAPGGISVFVYVLFEHKSYSDLGIAMQLLRYMTEIWVRECGGRNRIPILPIVVYHGGEPWKQPLSFGGFYEGGMKVQSGMLDFSYALADFSDRKWEKFPTHSALRAGLMALVAGSSDVDLDEVPLEPLPGEAPVVEDFAISIYAYLRHVRKDLEGGRVMSALMERLLQGPNGDLMSDLIQGLKDDLREEVKADLREEVRADLKEEVRADLKEEESARTWASAIFMYADNQGWTLSESDRDRISSASDVLLAAWFKAAMNSSSLEEMFASTDAEGAEHS